MNRAYWITGGVVAAAALTWALAMSSGPSSVQGPEMPPEEPQAAREPAPAEPTAEPTPTVAPELPSPSAPGVPSPAAEPVQPEAAEEAHSITAPQLSGPVAELRKQFESEPRSSAAPDAESKIEEAFRRPDFPGGLVKSVLCRTNVCKIETRWTRERAIAFMGGFMHLVAEPDPEHSAPFDHNLGIEPIGDERDGSKRIDVYLKRSEAPESATH